MFCKNCGKEIAEDAKFCPSCGATIGIETNTQAVKTENNEKLIPGWLILGFAIPLVGFVCTIIQWGINKTAGKSALYGSCIGMIFWYIVFNM